MEETVQKKRPIPFHQNPDAHVYGGPGDPPEEEIDWMIDWSKKIPEENRRPATSKEIITMMNEIRDLAATLEPGDYLGVKGRHEVVREVADQIVARNQGAVIVDHCEDGPKWMPELGYWESNLYVFANASEMEAFLEEN